MHGNIPIYLHRILTAVRREEDGTLVSKVIEFSDAMVSLAVLIERVDITDAQRQEAIHVREYLLGRTSKVFEHGKYFSAENVENFPEKYPDVDLMRPVIQNDGLFAYFYPGNRTPGWANFQHKQQEVIFCRRLGTIMDIRDDTEIDWLDSTEPMHRNHRECGSFLQTEDREFISDLADVIADISTEYIDPQRAKHNHLTLTGEDNVVGLVDWHSNVVVPESKIINRQSMSLRNAGTYWTHSGTVAMIEVPKEDIQYVMGMEAPLTKYDIPDGTMFVIRPQNMKVMSRNGNPMRIHTGDKVRYLWDVPFKGTLYEVEQHKIHGALVSLSTIGVPDNVLSCDTIFMIFEDGSLKSKLNGNVLYREYDADTMLHNPPFIVETASMERALEDPKWSSHMKQFLTGIVGREKAKAHNLIEKISPEAMRLIQWEGEDWEYAAITLYPSGTGEFNREALTQYLQAISFNLDGYSIPEDGSISMHFLGVHVTGSIKRGGIQALKHGCVAHQATRDMLSDDLMAHFNTIIHNRVEGAGGMLLGDPYIAKDTMVLSIRVANRMIGGNWDRDITEGVFTYWPSKFACIHKLKILIDPYLESNVIIVHPEIASVCGADHDGDLGYVTIDPDIVACAPRPTDPITTTDYFYGKTRTFPDWFTMVGEAKEEAETIARSIEKRNAWRSPENPFDVTCAILQGLREVGLGFTWRDRVCGIYEFDPYVYMRAGVVVHYTLDAMKVDHAVNVSSIIINDCANTANILGVKPHQLSSLYDGESGKQKFTGPAMWADKDAKRLANAHNTFSGAKKMQTLTDTANKLRTMTVSSETSFFEWYLSEMGLGEYREMRSIDDRELLELAEKEVTSLATHAHKRLIKGFIRGKSINKEASKFKSLREHRDNNSTQSVFEKNAMECAKWMVYQDINHMKDVLVGTMDLYFKGDGTHTAVATDDTIRASSVHRLAAKHTITMGMRTKKGEELESYEGFIQKASNAKNRGIVYPPYQKFRIAVFLLVGSTGSKKIAGTPRRQLWNGQIGSWDNLIGVLGQIKHEITYQSSQEVTDLKEAV